MVKQNGSDKLPNLYSSFESVYFGGELVKAGINPDDTTGWNTTANNNDTGFIGGQTNNTILTRSYVIGLRIGF